MSYTRLMIGAAVIAAVALAAPATAEAQNRRRQPNKKIDVAAAVQKLQSTDPEVARGAAKALAGAKGAAAVNGLLDALALGVHPAVAAAALDALAAQASPVSFDIVAYYTSHRDSRARSAAVRAMGALDDKRAHGYILGALHDSDKSVRAAAAAVVAERGIRRGVEPLIALLKKGDEATAPALAKMADPDMAIALGELIGVAPDDVLARALGLVLLKPKFGPETARVQVVRTLGKVPGPEAVEQLTTYIESIPEKPPRQSRREAEAIVEQRLTGGN